MVTYPFVSELRDARFGIRDTSSFRAADIAPVSRISPSVSRISYLATENGRVIPEQVLTLSMAFNTS